PYHEWLVEFESAPNDLTAFARDLDHAMTEQNIYYKDLIEGRILKPLVIRSLQKGSFIEYMRSQGKLGGQNKVPRLTNGRKLADVLLKNEPL
ncbi:MAG TPA: GH3 auxin-responsive promoter family protein, partial [Saprospiraceae bacterium]|nr:GH3 auxin-responsive promoter family protein [Saprospiraceae bacterium]